MLPAPVRWAVRWAAPDPDTPAGPVDDGHLDLRSLSTALGAWTSAWFLVQQDPRLSMLAAVAVAALIAVLFWVLLRNRGLIAWSHHWWSPLAAAVVGLFLVSAAISVHALAHRDPVLGALADTGATIRAEAVVTGDPRSIPGPTGGTGERLVGQGPVDAEEVTLLIEVQLKRYSAAGDWHAGKAEALLVADPRQFPAGPPPAVGARVSGLVRISRADPGERQGYWLTAAAPLATASGATQSLPTEQWRQRLAAAAMVLPGEGPALLPGMVMGDRSGQSAALSAHMKTAGLAHLTAVSGANVAMLLGTVLWIGRFCGIGRWPSLACSLLMLVGFVALVHPEPSVIRAAVMGAIGALAVYAGRGRQALTALCVCVVAVLAWDPWYAREPAFQLSALATAGIVLVGLRLARLGRRIMPGWLADGVAVSASAQLFCLPVLLGMTPAFSLYSIPANIISAPLVPPITVLGTLALVLCGLPGPWAQPLVWAAGLPASWIGALGHFVATLPGAMLPWPDAFGSRAAAVLLAILGVVSVWLAATPPGGRNPVIQDWVERGGPDSLLGLPVLRNASAWLADGGRRGVAAAAALAGLGLLAGLVSPATALVPVRPGAWQVAACDVGQGDAVALRTGAHSAMLIDTGPDPEAVDTCLAHLGVQRIDTLFITHLHADHAAGITGAIAGRALGTAYFSTATGRTSLPGLPAGLKASEATPGTTGRSGTVSWEVIGPIGNPIGEAENDASLAVIFHLTGSGTDFSMLAAGDLESEAMNKVLQEHPGLNVDVLKVSHHGAKNGGTAVIEACGARVALISVGAGNSYGHPTPVILHALRAAGMQTFRTDLHGTIRLHATADGVLVVSGRKGR
ncbi:ComEC/Rec2 family competence protein [Arthrobacter sp. JSM 101049]|uniref:ComEC/Rec2 family competence protein n=1 Tax=Arthrobacter sp. JSM 101049 TaxID=929097 RepID=UPI0035620EE8